MSASATQGGHNKTRTLAINVSIPNLTVARLAQFQRHNYRERERATTYVGTDRKLTILHMKCPCLSSEAIYR